MTSTNMKKLFLHYIFFLFLVPSSFQVSPFFPFFKMEDTEQYDIIINEIMEDVTLEGGGTLGLPTEEYIELYNRSDKMINLEGFTFSDGGARAAVFPAYILQPKSYLIIGKTNAALLADFGDFLALPNFPTLNSTELLTLKNEFGDIIDVVNYTQDWYGSTTKAGGGYALERINPNNPCLLATNWRGTTAFLGGTPGQENSVFESSINLPLELTNAYPLSTTQIQLTFNKVIQLEDLESVTYFSITNNEIIEAFFTDNTFNEVLLNLQKPLISNQIESVFVISTLKDCLGNPINKQITYPIAFPSLANEQDIIINEILFNPQTDGFDFVEIINRSEKVLDLKDILIANLAIPSSPKIEPILIQKLLFPNDFAAFTESPTDIKSRYMVLNPDVLYEQDLPSFNDKEGNVSLYTNIGNTTIFIDQFGLQCRFA